MYVFHVSKKTILRAVVSRGKPIFKEISELTDLYYKSYTLEKFVISIEHRCFFDTGIFRVPEIFRPNWIGTVRDPVDRYASIYYYRSKPLKERPPWLQLVKFISSVLLPKSTFETNLIFAKGQLNSE